MIDFLGIGAQKAGTTWLYRMLSTHPCIRFPAGKEMHFWNRMAENGTEWYLSNFPTGSAEIRQGEITPAYSMLSVETVRAIHAMNPDLRIIFLIRNPIDRAWSSALMALGRAEMLIDEASDAWFVDHFRSSGSRCRGDYETTLQRWLSVFPAGQLLLLRYEEVCHAPLRLLSRCATHLEVSPDPFAELPSSALSERVFQGPQHALRPSLRRVLTEIYREQIGSLGDYTGLDLSDWLVEA